MSESAVQGIECMKTVFWDADFGISPLQDIWGVVGREKRHCKGKR